MTTEDIRAELQQNIDEKYRAFHASLVPGIGTFLGVRVPKMREIAKKAAKEDYQTFFAEADVLSLIHILQYIIRIFYG